MSAKATSWVLENSPVTGAARMVLIVLADRADHEGRNAYPSVASIADQAKCSESTVHRVLRDLETGGHIVREGVSRFRTVQYRLVMGRRWTGAQPLRPSDPPTVGPSDLVPENPPTVGPKPTTEPSIEDGARARAITHKHRRVPDETVRQAEILLSAFNSSAGRSIGAWAAGGRPSAALKQIIGALLDRPDVPADAWLRAVQRTFAAPPGWVKGPVQLGHVFGEKAAEWALANTGAPDKDREPGGRRFEFAGDLSRFDRIDRQAA